MPGNGRADSPAPRRPPHNPAACGAGRTARCSARRRRPGPGRRGARHAGPSARRRLPSTAPAAAGRRRRGRSARATAGTSSRSRTSLSAAALLRQAQQPLQRHQQRVVAAVLRGRRCRSGMKRASPRGELAEHRADGRREGVDVGHHHDHVARAAAAGPPGGCASSSSNWSCRISTSRCAPCATWKTIERSAASTVAAAATSRARAAAPGRGCAPAPARSRVTPGAVVEQVDARQREALLRRQRVVEGVELAHEVAALAAPGGQQRVGVGVHVLQRHGGQVAALAQRVAAALRICSSSRPSMMSAQW